MRRRDFIKNTIITSAATAVNPSFLFDNGHPFPYDDRYFDAAERIVFLGTHEASINIMPREDKTLDLRVYHSHRDKMHIASSRFGISGSSPLNFYGVDDALEIPFLSPSWGPEFRYHIEYRESGEHTWKATPQRKVKTPDFDLRDRDMKVILIGDDHTPDDADMGAAFLEDLFLREARFTGEYVNLFLRELQKNLGYLPEKAWRQLMNGFCLAVTLQQIKAENPDIVVDLGDHRGGFGHKWEGLGLKNYYNITYHERDSYVEVFRRGTRKMFSSLTPEIPVYWALGNHDGELGTEITKEPAIRYRKKFFRLPGTSAGGSADENYYPILWGSKPKSRFIPLTPRGAAAKFSLENRWGGAVFLVLDSQGYVDHPRKPEDWTLGEEQKAWLQNSLHYETENKFVLFHHVLGGWPGGPDEGQKDIAYGRGPLFTEADYLGLCGNPKHVEQVVLTEAFRENGVKAILYGHDHIFHSQRIEAPKGKKDMVGICVGSPKFIGELSWYRGEFWSKYYGNFGKYGGSANDTPDFWGPSGYTRITIAKDGTKVEYVRSAPNNPHTNIPNHFRVGNVLSAILL